MSRRWNGKSLVDEIAARLWDTSGSMKAKIIGWINEIQDDIVSDLPMDYFKFKLKKLLPTQQDLISLDLQIPSAPTTALAAGGSLTEGSTYKVYVSFLIYDEDGLDYIESKASLAGTARTATATDKQIDLTAISTFNGSISVEPTTIYRRIYMSTLTSGGTSYGEPFYIGDIQDNTTTTYSITSEPTSTVTPVSDTEVERISNDSLIFETSSKPLNRESMNKLREFDPDSSESSTPSYFDYVGMYKIFLYPKLSSSATTDQRTLSYYVIKRPHEIFYDVDRPIDLPIIAKKAIIEGVKWKGLDHVDWDTQESKQINYEQYKKDLIKKMTRQKGKPTHIRDVVGDTNGYEV